MNYVWNMFGFYDRVDGHVTTEDVADTSRRLATLDDFTVQPESRSGAVGYENSVDDVGINFNKWRRPVTVFGPGDGDLKLKISRNSFMKDFDVGHFDWKESCKAVNVLLDNFLLKEIKAQAKRKFNGLSIDRYVKQGSSREGLKIRKADEFDTVLLYAIEGLTFDKSLLDNQPGLGMLKVEGSCSMSGLQQRYPQLYKEGVFVQKGFEIYLNSRRLHEGVFISLMDSAVDATVKKIYEAKKGNNPVNFMIKRQMNAPSINLTFLIHSDDREGRSALTDLALSIQVNHESYSNQGWTAHAYQIDVDVVPALQITLDTVPNPFNPRQTMNCPVYAVFKWRDEHQASARLFEDPGIIWRFCTSGYEKHIMDVAQTKKSQSYILTAARLVKAYVRSQKTVSGVHFNSFMKSYYIKNIALYCMLYVNVINGRELSGVKEALGYFIDFLDVSLIEKRLPHFFYSNEWIKYMFPEYEPVEGYKVDLYDSVKSTLVNVRESSWGKMKEELAELYRHDVFIYPDFKERFREFVKAGVYCWAIWQGLK